MKDTLRKSGLFLTGLAALVAVENANADFKYKDMLDFQASQSQAQVDTINPGTSTKGTLYAAKYLFNGIRVIQGSEPLRGEELFKAMTEQKKLPNGSVEYTLRPDLFKGKEDYLKNADVNPKDNHISSEEGKAFFESVYGKRKSP